MRHLSQLVAQSSEAVVPRPSLSWSGRGASGGLIGGRGAAAASFRYTGESRVARGRQEPEGLPARAPTGIDHLFPLEVAVVPAFGSAVLRSSRWRIRSVDVSRETSVGRLFRLWLQPDSEAFGRAHFRSGVRLAPWLVQEPGSRRAPHFAGHARERLEFPQGGWGLGPADAAGAGMAVSRRHSPQASLQEFRLSPRRRCVPYGSPHGRRDASGSGQRGVPCSVSRETRPQCRGPVSTARRTGCFT